MQNILTWTPPGSPAKSVPGGAEGCCNPGAASALELHPAAQHCRDFLWSPLCPCSQWPGQAQELEVSTHVLRTRQGEGTTFLPPSLGLTLTRHYKVPLSIPFYQNFCLAQHFPVKGFTLVHQLFSDTKKFPWKISDWPGTNMSISNEPLQASGDYRCVCQLEKGVICTLQVCPPNTEYMK